MRKVKTLTLEGLDVFSTPQHVVEMVNDQRIFTRTNAAFAGFDQNLQVHVVDRDRMRWIGLCFVVVVLVLDLLRKEIVIKVESLENELKSLTMVSLSTALDLPLLTLLLRGPEEVEGADT